MRLDGIRIDEYGPLSVGLDLTGGLQVVYGPNESGKTLLVDALLWLLLGENDDDRVGREPAGYVTIDEGDRVHRLDGDETILDRLRDRHGVAIGAREFRNTFVVRGADSHLADEDAYYDRATDVVAESLVADLDRVMDAVRDRGRITRTGKLIDRQDETKTRTHREDARSLKTEIEAFVSESREAGIPSLEAERFETERELDRAEREVERLEAAKRHEALVERWAARDELEEALSTLDDLPGASALDSLSGDVADGTAAVGRLDAVESRRDRAHALARLALVAVGIAALASLGTGWLVLSAVGPSTAGLVGVGLAAAVVAAIPGALSAYFWRGARGAERERDEIAQTRDDLLRRGRELGIEAADLGSLASRVSALEDRRTEARDRARELHGGLVRELDLASRSPEETLERATAELQRTAGSLDEEVDREFSAAALAEARAAVERLEAERDELDRRLTAAREEIRSFGSRVGDLPFGEYDLEAPRTDVERLEGLAHLVERLDDLVATIEEDADNARAAVSVLEAVKEDEQGRVNELFFGAESAVSAYFSRITGGRYESVHYDEGDNELWVRTAGGRELSPGALSQSTFDQLYLAVRVAFTRELLDEVTGVLLLDDAFLASDATRLDRQAEIVGELAAEGWQVLYFTAKADARTRLGDVPGATVHAMEPLR